ncbi:FAD-linked sulfhydryl oxidase ALR-like [Pollicipes pollicipes]|uniref:FAD-linked sulfhydryl oxidase ALR-like n=1 Tax=Pollicipes pollicipes TaxID=41117 RepID=UPI001884F30A|nr:FAD-linked sulfhydryl oxidase ALR-like [Pollicipes pollicipes]
MRADQRRANTGPTRVTCQNEEEHFGSIPRKPCRTCTDFKTWMKVQGGQKGSTKDQKTATAPEKKTAMAPPDGRVAAPPAGCPLDKDELGRSTWSLLHTTAAHYPETPTVGQQDEMRQFVGLLARLYPCSYCAEDFRKDLAEHPPQLESGSRLARWLCERHNTVNRKLGKPEFDCDLVHQRWRDGWQDGSCG